MGGGGMGGMRGGGPSMGGGMRMGAPAGVPRGTTGTFRGGPNNTWRGGTWNGNAWRGGAWNGNAWRGGTWNGNVWRGGTWNGAWRGGAWRGGYWGPGRYWGGRWWNVAPIHYYRPYYSFSPYFSLGFGLWAGYPVAWSYPYYYPYYYSDYPYPYVDSGTAGYSVSPPVDVTSDYSSTLPSTVGTSGTQDQSNLGGMSFEITPGTALVFIDGKQVGTVGQFTPSSQPLGVPAGRHHVEIHQSGYKTMSFDVDIVAGQVMPYQGQMER
jgi:hypothetical protein